MEGDHIKIREWLIPLSWLYGLGVSLRNALFDCGILHSESFEIPVISVGNITVGGTGTAILAKVYKSGCDVLVHHFETVD